MKANNKADMGLFKDKTQIPSLESDGKKLNINIQITFASGDIKVEKNFGTNRFYIKLNTANTTFLHKYCSKKENAQMHFYHHI